MITFIILMSLFLLIFLFIIRKIGKNNFLLNTFIFTWLIVLFALILFNRPAVDYISEEGIIIIFAHLFILGFGVLIFDKKEVVFKRFPLQIKLSITTLFYLFLGLSLLGLYMFSKSVNLIDAIVLNQVATLRSNLLLKEIEVSPATVLLTNFLYPLAAIAPVYTLVYKKKPALFFFIVILFVVYSLSSGGKGGIVLMIGTLMGAIIYLIKTKRLVFDKRIKMIAIIMAVFVFAFITFITYSRTQHTNESISDNTSSMFVSYFTNSVPAFCQILKENGYSLFNINLSQHNLVRNIGGLFGIKFQWEMDSYIVYVPQPFNVFSSLADSIFSLGLIGSLFYYFIIGIIMGAINTMRNINGVFLYSIFFLFSFYSFFVDIFYFMVGSWFCIAAFFVFKIKFPEKYLRKQKF
ncbi:oligosaccharide repeat unit polymerase [Elizabethkingia bruuniana]|uniref:Oligosaccharide repeat unit polymerase n=1 Tax=Elizabethkingia bruuniana TaxID=1756149 RepID=A0A7T7UVP8_9FLAO|nr:O-antigen polymerase [Elizabethkingia bruuniana]MDV3752649.1 oligosaccharide repeat unit polymerase [Elizabethkingia anophelis]AQX83651.1 hypothetical protein AYC65_00830 [Elizabethkingia bruuniana]KUY22234.1 hypothetical protein ATB97_13365 [Elizabethkingia bruuniana]OPB62445.1 hypothetical protein BAY12_11105 [Elizabethkingia bruuniana]QDZ63585.1 oligosaccharide repeat unit polymerase [Elizabethkingia bruuniana]